MCLLRLFRKRSAGSGLVDTIWRLHEHILKTEKRLNQLENKKDLIDIVNDELERINQDQRIIDNLNKNRGK